MLIFIFYFFQALELKPGDFNCLVARSQCHIELGNADAALADAESILEADPKHIKVSECQEWFG